MANSDLLACSSSSTSKSGQAKTTFSSNDKEAHKQQSASGSSRSRQRWQILSKAVRLKQFDLQELMRSFDESTSSSASNDSFDKKQLLPQHTIRDPLSVIETFGLINYHYESNDGVWIKCHLNHKLQNYMELNLDIKLVQNRLHLKDLVGFDNSGNVRVWSSEEALGYLLANNDFIRPKLDGKIICELGAGMTGLAGMICARLGLHRELYLTDGNERCVQNIEEIVLRNFSSTKKASNNLNGHYSNGTSSSTMMVDHDDNIHVQKLCWNQYGDYSQIKNHIETIICADCLFCSDAHQHLINTIDHLLVVSDHSKDGSQPDNADVDDGIRINQNDQNAQAIIMAPRRGNKLDRFISKVFDDGRFLLEVYETYDQKFTQLFNQLHQDDPQRYDPDTCYPYLLVMKRRPKTANHILD